MKTTLIAASLLLAVAVSGCGRCEGQASLKEIQLI